MTKILLYSLFLVFGLISSQFLGGFGEERIQLGTMFCLSFIMIHVGYEFEIDKSKPKQYGWDYLVAATAAMFPWLFCAGYFMKRLMFPRGEVGAGVLVVSMGYGLGGIALTVAVLSLALNLLLTGVFIIAVKKLIGVN